MFEQIRKQEADYPVSSQCEVLGVSTSGYYDWRDRPESPRERENQMISEKIEYFFKERDETYGSPRIYENLKESGISCSENRVARLMSKMGLKSVHRRKYTVTTDSDHSHSIANNLLDRDFTADAPNQKWAGDITYVHTDQGWLYLSVVMDLFSRQIVGWSMGDTLEKSLVVDALTMATCVWFVTVIGFWWIEARAPKAQVHLGES